MRILWHSNAPWAGSGYGVQTDIFCHLLAERGHEVVVSAFFGLQGAKLNTGKMLVLPGSYTGYGDDMLPITWERIKPDATILLIDSWVFTAEQLQKFPAGIWAPVDSEPIAPQVAKILPAYRHVWAMSRHGERQMRQVGLDPFYVPHGVNVEWYKPIDRATAREALNIPQDVFFVACTAANKGFPPRKNLDVLIKAFAKFHETHEKARLYLHTLPITAHGGMDIYAAREFYGVEKGLMLPDIYRYNAGEYTPNYLNMVYNAADAFILPSAGEGFGVPIIEAQAAGCPAIVADCTAMRELGQAGYKIPVDTFDGLRWTVQSTEQANVLPSQIVSALEWAWEQRGNQALRDRARDFAMGYDHHTVFDRYLLPALECMAEMDADLLGALRGAAD